MKPATIFVCTECDRRLPKWMGRCPECGQWNTVIEKERPVGTAKQWDSAVGELEERGGIRLISEIATVSQPRLKTGIDELDRVLGGGLVPRSVVLVGGDPGIGKSTLLMQALGSLARKGRKVLYASGEESAEQLSMRADRLKVASDGFLVLMENRLEPIVERIGDTDISVVVVDSVQSLFSRSVESAPGSLTQVRLASSLITDAVKRSACACFIVGHVTKGGDLAGPKVMEHIVDTVLYFEGDRSHSYRILRAVKNRFGSANEIGVFEMGDRGLREVANPSELFLAERPQDVSGSVVTALVEGSRPILVEVQALVSGPVPGQGRRTCLGIDSQRLALMIAVLEKKLGLTLGDQDIFVNAVGGVRAVEPSTDLAVAAALLSSITDRPVPAGTIVFGEVGLAGEVRGVYRWEPRMNEAARLGYKRIIAPRSNVDPAAYAGRIAPIGISHVSDLGRVLFETGISPSSSTDPFSRLAMRGRNDKDSQRRPSGASSDRDRGVQLPEKG